MKRAGITLLSCLLGQYREVTGDFILETVLSVRKQSDAGAIPDDGFQQGGLIIRQPDSPQENSLLLSLGTGSNSNLKLFARQTTNGKSQLKVDKNDAPQIRLRIVKNGSVLTWHFKNTAE
jgi:hypothetical protein